MAGLRVGLGGQSDLQDAVVVLGLDVLLDDVAGDPDAVVDPAPGPVLVTGLLDRVDRQDAVFEPEVDLLGLEARDVRLDDLPLVVGLQPDVGARDAGGRPALQHGAPHLVEQAIHLVEGSDVLHDTRSVERRPEEITSA